MTIFSKLRMALLLVFIMIAGIASAQTISIKADNKKLSEVLKTIQTQTPYKFAYNNSMINADKLISINVENATINEVLKKLFGGTEISYKITDKLINLSPKKFDNNSRQKGAPNNKISGRVTDNTGEGVPGALVMLKGSKSYVMTDTDGNFNIAANTDDVLVISSLGMKDVECNVDASNNLKIKMETDMLALDDVVVTGFQTLSKERATGSFAKVTSAELEKNITTNLSDKIASSMNGVYVNPDGKIEIRGLATLNTADGKTDPLIVVDGFPIEGGLSSINPDEIESITVLRDAAAASIYGIKSANGVIVVNRKSADRTKFNINASVNYTFTEKPSMSYLNLMNAAEAVDFDWEQIEKGLWNSRLVPSNDYGFSELGCAWLLLQDGKAEEANEIKNRLASYGELTNKQYEEEIFRRSQTGQYNISISGASRNAEYYVSGRIEDYKSYNKGNGSVKYFLNSRLKLSLTDKLIFTIATTNNYTNGTSNSPISIYNYYSYILPYEPLIVNGELNPRSEESVSYFKRDLAKQIGLLPNGIEYNPINDLNYSNRTNGSHYNRYQTSLEYVLDFGLKLDLKYQYEDGGSEAKSIFSPQTYGGAKQINRYAEYDGANTIFHLDKEKSLLTNSSASWKSQMVRCVASYNESFAKKHYISTLAGLEIQNTTTDIKSDNFCNYDVVTGYTQPDFSSVGSYYTNWEGEMISTNGMGLVSYRNSTNYQRYFSFFFNGGYTYNNRYNLTGSFRIDQSNIFGTNSKYRYKPMWSVGASWNIYKENFMSSVTWINNLTLRATYGLTGMIDKSTSPYVIISKGNFPSIGDYASFINAPNPNLRWEQTKNMNIGLDFSVMNNRLNGYIEFYNKYTTDIIAPTLNDPTNGFSTITANTAEISNRGIDININSLNIDKAFKWNTTLNFSYNKNRVEKIYVNKGFNASYYIQDMNGATNFLEKYAIDQLFSYKWAGLDNEGYAQIYDKDGNIVNGKAPGNLKKDDLVDSGRTQPPFFGNFTNTFSWNEFVMTVNISYKLGYYTRPISSYQGFYSKYYANRWRTAGDEVNTNVPGIHDGTDYSGLYARCSNINVMDASHIRLNYINLSYSLPYNIIKNTALKDISFNFQASNLGIIWKANDNGIDPDVHAPDGTPYRLPAYKTFIFGLNIKF